MGQPWSAGKRMIEGRGELYTRSMAEANWARWLQFLLGRGEVREWWYEPCFFEFPIKHGTTRYTPDFLVLHPDGTHHWEELKGWKKPKGETALKRMAKYHPEVELRVIDWSHFRAVERSVSGLVPGWEFFGQHESGEVEAALDGVDESLGMARSLIQQVLAQGGTIEQLEQLGGRRKR